jgi:hypothetical protein
VSAVRTPASPLRVALRVLLPASLAATMLAGVAGGLLRAGVALPGAAGADWLGRAALEHAALIVCAFLGTVIGIERAVAARHRAAFLAPVASIAAGACLLLGARAQAAALLVVAALAFTAATAVILRRQPAAHTRLLVVAALAWLAGNLLYAGDAAPEGTLAWWFAFLVLTIAAERLDMTRLMRRRPAAQPAFAVVVALMIAGAAASVPWPRAGGVAFGAALVLLAAWLGCFDVARRTVRAHGLARYMAVCLLAAYGWLAVAGVAWAGTALGWPARDAALHALGLGFVVSMAMGHAPVVLPAVARVKLAFGPAFYLPVALLHASLVLRLGPGASDSGLRAWGAALDAAAIVLFAITLAGAALAWRMGTRRAQAPAPVAPRVSKASP